MGSRPYFFRKALCGEYLCGETRKSHKGLGSFQGWWQTVSSSSSHKIEVGISSIAEQSLGLPQAP